MSDTEAPVEVQVQEEFEVVEEFTTVTLATPIPEEVQQAQREIKLFNKWSFEDVEVKDASLVDYVQVRQPIFVSSHRWSLRQQEIQKGSMSYH